MERTWKPVAAGIIDILAGFIWIAGVGFLALVGFAFYVWFGSNVTPASEILLGLVFIGVALPGAFAIVGGIFSIRRRVWGVSLAGSICAALAIIGVASIVLVALSRREFQTGRTTPGNPPLA